MSALNQRLATDPQQMLLDQDGFTTALEIITPGSATVPAQIQVLKLRNMESRPMQYEPGGALGPLVMANGTFPADVTYVQLWPNGIAAQDYHPSAPTMGRLSFFLRHRMSAYVSFEQLYQRDTYERLKRLRGKIRGIDISLTRPEYSANAATGVLQELVPAVVGRRALSVSVHLGMGRFGPRDRYFDSSIEEAVFQAAEEIHDQIDRLRVTGVDSQTGKSTTVNFLNERLQVEEKIPPDSNIQSLPDADATFQLMDAAYNSFSSSGSFDDAPRAQAALR